MFASCFRLGAGYSTALASSPEQPFFTLGSPEDQLSPPLGNKKNMASDLNSRPSFSVDASNYISPAVLADIHAKFKLAALRRGLITEAEKLYSAENFRFLAAVIDWESASKLDSSQRMMNAYKIIATFVDSGARYEVNLTPRSRQALVDNKARKQRHVDPLMFESSKIEIIRDVLQNPALKSLLANAGIAVTGSLL